MNKKHGFEIVYCMVMLGLATLQPVYADLADLVAGFFHTCALGDAGVKCWGYDFSGQTTVPDGLGGGLSLTKFLGH